MATKGTVKTLELDMLDGVSGGVRMWVDQTPVWDMSEYNLAHVITVKTLAAKYVALGFSRQEVIDAVIVELATEYGHAMENAECCFTEAWYKEACAINARVSGNS